MSGSVNPNPWAALTADDFQQMVARQFPRGPAWPVDPASVWMRLLGGIADLLAALNGRIADLTERESDPAQTVELLPAWETDYGLPDPCSPPAPTIAQRQGALLAKIAGTPGGQSPDYFINIAAALGYGEAAVPGALTLTDSFGIPVTDDTGATITAPSGISIETFGVFTAGSGAGLPLNGPDWRYTWRITTPGDPVTYFAAGSGAGEPLTTFGNAELQCRISAVAPAHTVVLFASS